MAQPTLMQLHQQAHGTLIETRWIVDGLMALAGATDDELEALTGAQLMGLLKPVSDNLNRALTTLDTPTGGHHHA
ncbi:hypothetical protein HMF8227_02324 [Saliniradius amylolyticus]|uniref:Uncharacterized protein n=1 Tax=Saliniradius amylolyticus TaxID=2183582 RepID=A0A2S2E543_9ALTE|nr:hypothetical protein [Saliniradius amylolyticus]AWL12776.1 hypothetical protein HMF8227_02324 [Saliniradius amylolyticus]